MRKFKVITCLLLMSNVFFAQQPELEITEDVKEQTITKIAPLSIGFSPFVYVGVNDYSSEGLGLGLELMSLYELNKNFNAGAFVKIKGAFSEDGPPFPGEGYNGDRIVSNGSGSIGAIVEYKMFNKIGFNFRIGYEEMLTQEYSEHYNYDPLTYETIVTKVKLNNDPGLTYGGGISLYTTRRSPHKVTHSFNWGVNFEKNNFTTIDMLDIQNNRYSRSTVNAFYFHFGWRMMLHGLKPGKGER